MLAPRSVLLGVLAGAVVVWAVLVAANPYVGHDEGVYAGKARSWGTGLPAAGWRTYRPVGLPALGRLAWAVQPSLGALRVVSLLLALGTLVAAYLLAARVGSPRQAGLVALVVLGGLSFQHELPQFLTDIAAAGLTLGVCYLLLRAAQERRAALLPVAAVLAVVAFYLRYGVLGGLLAVAAGAVVAFGPRRWLALWPGLLAAVAVVAVGLAPHLWWSTRVTGSPLGVVRSAGGEVFGEPYVGAGLVDYLRLLPVQAAGPLGGALVAAGVAHAVRVAWRLRRTGREQDRAVVFLAVAAGLQVLVLGITTHGEARFVLAPVAALTAVGVAGLAEWAGRRAGTVLARAVLAVVAVAAVAAVPVTTAWLAQRSFGWLTESRQGLAAAGQAIAAAEVSAGSAGSAGSGRPCLVVTAYQPQVGWYSRCDAAGFTALRRPLPADRTVAVVLTATGSGQPSAAAAVAALRRGGPVSRREFAGGGAVGAVTVVARAPPTGR